MDTAMDTITDTAGQVSRRARRAAGKARRTAQDKVGDVLPLVQPKRSRRWPWLLGIAVVAAGAAGTAYAMRGRQQSTTDDEQDRAAMNGAAPQPRREQQADSPAGRS